MPDEEKLSSYLSKSKLISNSNYAKKIRIAILGGFTLNGLEETMKVKCDEKKYNVQPMYLDIISIIRKLSMKKANYTNFLQT